ncbi:hypothetical protein KI387_036697, partial [Taxus chinensis]
MNLKCCSSFPQFCNGVGVGVGNAHDSLYAFRPSQSYSKVILMQIQGRPKDYNAGEIHGHCKAQRSVVDMFLQGNGNASSNNAETSSYEKGGIHDKKSSEADFLHLARQSSAGDNMDMDMVAQESVLVDNGSGNGSGNLKVNSDSRKQAEKAKRSSVIAKQVISKTSALSMGFVSQLWVDTSSWIVQMVEIRPSMFSGEVDRFFLKDLCQVGDVILIEDENVLDNELTMTGLDTLVGYDIITEDRFSLGKVRDYKFNINAGDVAYLEFDCFGVSFIPPSVVSTYCLLVEDVIDITSDTIVVRSGADVRVQRLTK